MDSQSGELRVLYSLLQSLTSNSTHQFTKGMKAQRSNTATRLRRHCAALFGISESDMLRTEIRKEKFRSRIGWVDNECGSGSYSTVDVELLHKDFTGSYDIKTAFLNPVLMWVSFVTAKHLRKLADQRFSGLCRYYPGSHCSQGVDAWDPVKSKD